MESDNTNIKKRLTAAEGDITTLTSKSVTIEDKADAANNNYITLTNGNGTFTGNVNAKTLVAGDPNGINIRTSSNKIEFCQGADTRAYFEADGSGMQLHVWDASGVEHVIDFTSGTFVQVNGSSYSPVRGYYKYNGKPSTPFISDSDLFKGSDGKYYGYSGSTYSLISSRDVYILESANSYPTTGNGFAGSYVPIIYAYVSNNGKACAVSVTVNRYVKYTITNGVMGSASTNYIYHSPDYPISPVFDGDDLRMQSSSFGGRFINPQGGSASFMYSYTNGVKKDFGTNTQTYNYVSTANAGAEYSTDPTVYDIDLFS